MRKSLIIVIVITALAVMIIGIRRCSMPEQIQIAKAGIKEGKVSAEGIIVYNEEVYLSENDGTFYSYVNEGERIAKNKCVATVYDGVVDKEILQSLNNVEKKIVEIEKEHNNDTVYVNDESSKQMIIENIREDIIDAVIEGDIYEINEYREKLEVVIGISDGEGSTHSLSELKEEKRQIEEKISQEKKDVFSDMAGIYTTAIDGLEGEIKLDNLENYKVADFRNLKSPEDKIMGNRTVKKGDKICKVVDNHEWYAVCVVNAEDIKRIKVGDKVKLRVEKLPGMDVDATVEYISKEEKNAGEYLVSVKPDQYLEGVFNIRKSKVEIVMNSFYGYEVPVYAIRVKEGKHGVMVRGNENEIFKECVILYRDDEAGTVIIEPSDSGSRLIDGDQIIIGYK